MKNSSIYTEEGATVEQLQPPTDTRILTISSVSIKHYTLFQQTLVIREFMDSDSCLDCATNGHRDVEK